MGNLLGKYTTISRLHNNSNYRSFDPHPELSVLTTGHIPDPTLISGLGIAVATNNVALLRILLRMGGVPINATHYDGHTLLHAAIMNESTGVFKYLIGRDDLDLDAPNTHETRPLTVAAFSDKMYYVKKLIEKGANVNKEDNLGGIPLHYASIYGLPKLCQILIKSGSNVNARNLEGQTPLYLACRTGKAEIIHMLLFYGADVSIPCQKGIFPLMLEKVSSLDMLSRLILYHYTFDEEGCSMELKSVTEAMVRRWPLFPTMLNKISQIIYNKSDLQDLNDALLDIKPEYFKLFIEKFDYIFKDMLLYCCTLTNYLTDVESMKRFPADFLNFIHILLESDLICDIIQSCCVSVSPISSLINIFRKSNLPVSTLTKLVCCLLSYGVNLTPADLNAAYVFYGRCELFDIMLHMEMNLNEFKPCCTLYDHEVIQKSIMPYFIYDVNLNIETFIRNPQPYLLMDLDVLLDYFAVPDLQNFFLADGTAPLKVMKKLDTLPSVPSLLELARNVARDHIVQSFNIKSSSQFYTVMKWLPINSVYKSILSFEKKLYYD